MNRRFRELQGELVNFCYLRKKWVTLVFSFWKWSWALKKWMVLFVVCQHQSQDVGACDLWPLARSTIHPFSALLQLWVSNKSRKKNTTNLNSKHFLVDPETQQKICFPNKSITIPVLIILWNLVGHWNCTRELKKIMS